MKIRLSVLASAENLDDLTTLCLPSLFQSENVPWLLENGYETAMTVYAAPADADRVLGGIAAGLAPHPASARLEVTLGKMEPPQRPGPAAYGRQWLLTEVLNACREPAAMMLLHSGMFYGNATLRHLAAYCRRPRVVTFIPYLCVERERFAALLLPLRREVSNANLVDIALRCLSASAKASNVAEARNAAFRSGTAIRELRDGVTALVQHVPALGMFWPQADDLDFFRVHGERSVERLWGEKLLAEDRMRLLAASDLAFCVDCVSSAMPVEDEPVLEDGKRYDETFYYRLPHTLVLGQFVMALRREAYVS